MSEDVKYAVEQRPTGNSWFLKFTDGFSGAHHSRVRLPHAEPMANTRLFFPGDISRLGASLPRASHRIARDTRFRGTKQSPAVYFPLRRPVISGD